MAIYRPHGEITKARITRETLEDMGTGVLTQARTPKNRHGIDWERIKIGASVTITPAGQLLFVEHVKVEEKSWTPQRVSLLVRRSDGSRARCGFDQVISI